jgi:hypothetical protein
MLCAFSCGIPLGYIVTEPLLFFNVCMMGVFQHWVLATRGTRKLDKAAYMSYFSIWFDELLPSESKQDDLDKAASIQVRARRIDSLGLRV